VLTAAGHDADDVLARIATDEVKNDLRARTDEAIALGIFGVPVYRLDGGPIFWGQDRMPQVSGLSWDEIIPPAVPASPAAHAHSLELYWDFSSPFAYLGYLQAEALARRTSVPVTHRPMLLGALFKQVGQPMVPLATWSPAKQAYYGADMLRSAEAIGAPFKFPSRFPISSIKALRVYLALPEGARRDAFARAAFAAYWAEDRDISDDAVLRALIGEGADEVLARTQTPEVKQALIDSTARAATVGAFGAPTWVVDGKDVYWGQDRLVLVERALKA